MAVPPLADRLSMARFTCARSLVSGALTPAPVLKLTRPTWSWLGSLSTNVFAASLAATIRFGLRSLAAIEPETSITSMTAVWSFGTATTAIGRARLTSSAASPSR